MWNASRLRAEVEARIGDRPVILLSNRGPLARAGGMIEVVEPLARASCAEWVAQVQTAGASKPSEEPYRLHPLTLDAGCATSFGEAANSALWPLLHDVGVAARYSERAWAGYVDANHRFAELAIEVAETRGHDAPIFFLQDYHLLLVSALLRRRFPRATIAQFIHVSWPAPDAFARSPWAEAIRAGVAGNDLLGLNSAQWAQHAAAVAPPGVRVETFPAGIDAELFASQAAAPEVTAEVDRLRDELRSRERTVVVSIDRSDYSKGISARLAAIRLLLERRPDLRGRVVFAQVVSPSRIDLEEFIAVGARARQLADEINHAFGTDTWQPVHLFGERVSQTLVLALYRLADACVVSSLRDGMNLVAKEYVACRGGDDGCLVLSRYAGAAERMTEAVIVDPTDASAFADALASALTSQPDERRIAMRALKHRVLTENVYWWGAALFGRIADLMRA